MVEHTNASFRRLQHLERHLQQDQATKSPTMNLCAANARDKIGVLNPFHHAFPVHDLEAARKFYGTVLGCAQGREAPAKWIDYNLYGHQIVAHFVGADYRAPRFFNPVDGDEVPVPHFGVVLSIDQFHILAARLKEHQVKFEIEPHLRFKGFPGEQWTMFFYDQSGNALEFKAMANPDNLFAKYTVNN